MSWIQMRTTVTQDIVDATEESLMAAGASAVTLLDAADQPILEPELGTHPVWKRTTLIGLFSADTDTDEAQRMFREVFALYDDGKSPQLTCDLLENEDWTRKWMENFKPLQCGSRLWICPSWCEPPDPKACNLLLDPGLAFGTGTHPTTRLCLEWLDQAKLNNRTVIDYGCGSGILAIAAALLGAESVIAIDNDPQALIATRENAKRNKVSASIETFLPQDTPSVKADILLANILAQPLTQLRDALSELVQPEGQIVLSGILLDQAEMLRKHYGQAFEMLTLAQDGDWVRLAGTKPAT